jgi:hypothetical protein
VAFLKFKILGNVANTNSGLAKALMPENLQYFGQTISNSRICLDYIFFLFTASQKREKRKEGKWEEGEKEICKGQDPNCN